MSLAEDIADLFAEAAGQGRRREWFDGVRVFRAPPLMPRLPPTPEELRRRRTARTRWQRERYRAIDAELREIRRARTVARLGYVQCRNRLGPRHVCQLPSAHEGRCTG